MNTKHRDRVFLWMILPALAGFMLLFIVPTLMSFAYSITNWSVYNPELRIVGIKNFAQLFLSLIHICRKLQSSFWYRN